MNQDYITQWKGYSDYMGSLGQIVPDISELVDEETGMPFPRKDQMRALEKASKATEKFFKQQQQYETDNAESALKQKQRDYQQFLATSADDFQAQKTQLDENAAEKGVLFSGGRQQRENDLKRTFERDQAYRRDTMGAQVGDIARDYQYAYGNDAAKKLSKYYKLGSNMYNPDVATNGAKTGGLSSVYRTGSSDFFGRRNAEQSAENQQRAAGLLWNKGNKLVTGGYGNKY